MTLFYARDVAEHFLVELETAEEWFRQGIIKEADHAAQLSGHWVTTEDQILRAKGIDPVLLDAASRARLMEAPVTIAELAWLLSAGSKRLTAGSARKRLRRSRIAWFKLPGSKLMFAHRVDVERVLNRATRRDKFLEYCPEERKPSLKPEKPGI